MDRAKHTANLASSPWVRSSEEGRSRRCGRDPRGEPRDREGAAVRAAKRWAFDLPLERAHGAVEAQLGEGAVAAVWSAINARFDGTHPRGLRLLGVEQPSAAVKVRP